MSNLIDAAAFISQQWPVFPCGADKRPVTGHGFKDAVTDPNEVRRLFRTPGTASIGVPTGIGSNLAVVDLDVKEGAAGLEWLAANEHRIPATRRHQTRSGGIHLLFSYPQNRRIRNSVSKLAPGVDIRGEGGYIIVPPSTGYSVVDAAMPVEMPAWLVDLIDPPYVAPPRPAAMPRPVSGDGSPYGLAALERECAAVANAPPGIQEVTLNNAGLKLGALVAGGELPHGMAMSGLISAGNMMAPAAGERAWAPDEVRKKVERALAAGASAPRNAPPREVRHVVRFEVGTPHDDIPWPDEIPEHLAAEPDVEVEPQAPAETPSRRKREAPKPAARAQVDPTGDLTEDGVALAYADMAAGKVVFDHTERRWAEWDGAHWLRDGKEKVFDGVRQYVRNLRETAEKPPSAMAKAAFITSVERFVRADPRIAVEHDVWDADPWVLGVPGGVVDLKTGQLREGRPEEYVSRQCGVAPAAPGSPPHVWLAFLDAALGGDQETIRFLQKFMGYCLTGDVREEVLAFFYGSGGNGKGVFLSTWTGILGDYAVAMPMEAFTAGSGAKLEYYRARMAGHRLVTASETETGAVWAESQIKELTGNEAPVSARHPHGRPFEYRPQFKLGIVGNHAPALKGRSAAMERRLRVVPFDRVPPKPDDTLKTRLREEYPAILQWMIEGCLLWQAEKLGTSPAVAKASGAYFEAQDGFGRWLEECCILDRTLRSKPSALLAAYTQWAKANGEEPPNAMAFTEMVDRHPALSRMKTNGVRLVVGAGLKAPEAQTWSDR